MQITFHNHYYAEIKVDAKKLQQGYVPFQSAYYVDLQVPSALTANNQNAKISEKYN